MNESLVGPVVAGIDIGGTKISALLVDERGLVVARREVASPALEGGAAMADAAAGAVTALANETAMNLDSVGVGAAGVVDHSSGSIRAASELFPGWAGFPLAEELRARLQVPVHVENDVNAFLLGESQWGAATDPDVLGVMLGTGVGGAIILNGLLRHGPHGAAGEIGHTPGFSEYRCTCGQTGHLETLASGTSIGHHYGERSGTRGLAAREVARRARAGDPIAIDVFHDAGEAVALAVITTAAVLDISQAVVGGGVATAWDLLQPAIRSTLAANAPVSGGALEIVPGALGGDAVALGAAAASSRSVAALVV